MAKLDIVRAGRPVLRARAKPVATEEFGEKSLKKLIETMVLAMRRAPGVGLAAPQIGISKRVIVLEDAERLMARVPAAERLEKGRTPFALRAICNPELTVVDASPCTFFEGCLSVPGYSALVERAQTVRVTGQDEQGAAIDWEVSGWAARILQHEVDHLNGTLYVDRMITRSFGENPETEQHWARQKSAEVLRRLAELFEHGEQP